MSLCTLAASPRQALRGIIALVSVPLPEPTVPARSRAEVFVRYLDYFRSRVITKIEGLPERALRQSQLPSGWTPVELLKHLSYVELRWLEWGFEGRPITDPWGDNRGDRSVRRTGRVARPPRGRATDTGRAQPSRHRGPRSGRDGQTRSSLGRCRPRDSRAHPVPSGPGVCAAPRTPRHRRRARHRQLGE